MLCSVHMLLPLPLLPLLLPLPPLPLPPSPLQSPFPSSPMLMSVAAAIVTAKT